MASGRHSCRTASGVPGIEGANEKLADPAARHCQHHALPIGGNFQKTCLSVFRQRNRESQGPPRHRRLAECTNDRPAASNTATTATTHATTAILPGPDRNGGGSAASSTSRMSPIACSRFFGSFCKHVSRSLRTRGGTALRSGFSFTTLAKYR